MNQDGFNKPYNFEMEVKNGLQLLREHKVRITPQRRLLLEYLIKTDAHPTVEEIYSDLRQNENLGISLATIYNNLKVLVDVGLVNEMKFSNVTSRYDYKGHSHRHILCTNCGKIGDFHYDEIIDLEKNVAEQTGYQVSFNKLEVYGLCPECRKL